MGDDNMAAPRRSKNRDFTLEAIVERDGSTCFMCGMPHGRIDQLQVDWVDNPSDNLEMAFAACKTCVRRRDGRALGGYMKQRMSEARREYEYLQGFRTDAVAKEMFNRPIIMRDA
jgi:hypothetical protein